jgi:hypothetical protein
MRPDMTITDTTTTPSRAKKRAKRLGTWAKKAAGHGVSTRTLDRWAEDGRINKPTYINGRKFGDLDETPRSDAEVV